MRTVELATLDDLNIVLNVARQCLEKSGKQSVIIKNFEESLSDRQRGLYWRWVGVICADTGDTKDDFHRQAKERIYLPVYLRDPENHINLYEAVETMKSIKSQLEPEKYRAIREFIVDQVSHLDATVKNMAEVLKQVKSEAINLGIALPPPPGPGLY